MHLKIFLFLLAAKDNTEVNVDGTGNVSFAGI